MAFIKWNPKLAVGVDIIDTQHQALFDRVNTLFDAMQAGHGRDEIGKTLTFLANYTVEHFKTEEGLMQKSAYPGYKDHKAIHDDLTQKVVDLQGKLDKGSQMLSLPVMHFLRDWLTHHISEEDKKLAAHLNQVGLR
ncbi:bacteriohemerythrin [Geothrix sp. PMB-07]|uniref:bacteriohemerythrin n=1 Tax=Geothrix sp. PMB-07 TaxID=3068640 RepID=UPI002742968B|nr:bacteriohemerythrin [Geothrix sp. PMB-07]WLT32491.1 bacteriohemerythrin [Geothrix sp. PMB-07]